MTVETIEVLTAQAASEAATAVTVISASSRSGRLDTQTWTMVTEAAGHIESEPSGRETLVVFDGAALRARLYGEPDGSFVLEDIGTGIFGSGDTLQEAVHDLNSSLRSYLAVLADDDALSPNLQHQLELLRSYFNTP